MKCETKFNNMKRQMPRPTSCTSAQPQAVANAIRVRQSLSPFMEASVTGFVPAGGIATPAPVSPY